MPQPADTRDIARTLDLIARDIDIRARAIKHVQPKTHAELIALAEEARELAVRLRDTMSPTAQPQEDEQR